MYTRKDTNNFAWSQGRLQKEVISGRVGKSRSLLGEEERRGVHKDRTTGSIKSRNGEITKRVPRHFLLCTEEIQWGKW